MPELQIPSADFNVELVQGGVKAAIKETGAKTRDFLMVPVKQLKIVAGLNVRIQDAEYEAHIEEIKESILENGYHLNHPIAGFAGKEGDNTFIYVTGGFTRLEAAKRAIAAGAPMEEIPVVLKPAGTSMLDLTLAFDQENTANRLKPFERAIVIKRAIGFGADEPTIARKMGISEQYVKDLLYLMGLPTALRGMVTSGKAGAGHVIQLARKIGPSEALKAFEASVPHDTANGEDQSASNERVTPRATSGAASARAKGPIIPKKTLFNAIDYAIALPGDGIKWLASWRQGEKDAVSELASYKPPRKNAKKPKVAKAKAAKAAKGKGKSKSATPKDPFDTNGTAVDDSPL